MRNVDQKLPDYEQWLQRVRLVIRAYEEGLIQDADLAIYQLFILEFGQFNANFTLDELERLEYPKSPFALMHRHTYLRGTESWAVEILRQWFVEKTNKEYSEKQAKNTKLPKDPTRVYPVFVDSRYFWEELDRYVVVVNDPSELSKEQLGKLSSHTNQVEGKEDERKREVNTRRWYRDDDISEYVNLVIRRDLGGYREGCSFALNQAAEGFTHACFLGAIDTIELGTPIDFFFDYSQQQTPDSVDDRRDVFHDLFDDPAINLLSREQVRVQILFPYNITNVHWLTGEVILEKEGHHYTVRFTAHDPYGAGEMDSKNIEQLKEAIAKRISSYDQQAQFTFVEEESPYPARQDAQDSVSCGVVAARDMVCRLQGQALTPQEGPFPVGASDLRRTQLEYVEQHGDNPGFVHRNTTLPADQFSATITADLSEQVWVRLNQPEDKKQAEEKIRQVVETHVIDKEVKKEAIKGILKRTGRKYSAEEKALLESFLAVELAERRKDHEEKYQKAQEEKNQKRELKSWYGPVFGLFKKQNNAFLTQNKIRAPKELKTYAESEPDSFEEQYNKLEKGSGPDLTADALYAQAIDKWKNTQVSPLLNRFYYFVPQRFMGIETLVLVGHKEAESSDAWGPKSLVNHLGYRVDPVRAMRKILERYSKLFVDPQETEAFWPYLTRTPMIEGLKQVTPKGEEDKSDQALIAVMPDRIYSKRIGVLSKLIDIRKTEQYKQLAENREKLPLNFQFYADFLLDYLSGFAKLYPKDWLMQHVCTLEIVKALDQFNNACRSFNMSQAVRAVQVVTEILRLDLSVRPLKSERLLTEFVRTDYLNKFPVQSVLFASYGMRSYARVLQADESPNRASKKEKTNIFVTNQNYFEWLINLGLLQGKSADITHIRHLTDLDPTADLIFMEIHPNNVTERKQFAQHLSALFKCMNDKKWGNKKRTLVIDATLNAFDDDDIQQALTQAMPLLNSGRLNIVLLQSLTKFAQVGVDERSGGVMVVLNNGKDWQFHNQRCEAIAKAEPVDPSTLQFFSYFFNKKGLTKRYIQLINNQVNYVYQKINEQLSLLEVGTRQRFQLTVSSDSQGCYVALNMRGILPGIDAGFRYTSSDIEAFGGDILDQFLIPLCEFYGLPLTRRMSIAFPLSSMNNVLDTLRFTVGLESKEQLDQYAEIIAYISFSLNRFPCINLLFEKDEDSKCAKREQFFLEKVGQFKAMTPGRDFRYQLDFNKNEYGPADSRVIAMRNGQMVLRRHEQDRHYDYNNRRIGAYLAGVLGAVPLENIEAAQRRMVAACFTALLSQNEQPLNLTFDDSNGTLALSFNIINLSSYRMIYGPFKSTHGPVYFEWFNNQMTFFNNYQRFNQQAIFVRQSEITIPFTVMPLEERDFLFKAAAYTPDGQGSEFMRYHGCSYSEFYNRFPQFKHIRYQYIPLYNDPISLSFNEHGLVIERDFTCVKKPGITVYKRFFNGENTGIELDYWQEKDPVLCRFFCFAIAVCVNTQDQVAGKKLGFRVRSYYGDGGHPFTHFLFRMVFSAVDKAFAKAIDLVFAHRSELIQTLAHHSGQSPGNSHYGFFSENYSYYTDVNAYGGQDYINEGELVDGIVKALGFGK